MASAKAVISGSTVDSTDGSVLLSAKSTSDIHTLSIAGAGSAAAGAGTSSTNAINNTIEAAIISGANISAKQAIKLTAIDDPTIVSDAGAGALGIAARGDIAAAISVGAGISENTSSPCGANRRGFGQQPMYA